MPRSINAGDTIKMYFSSIINCDNYLIDKPTFEVVVQVQSSPPGPALLGRLCTAHTLPSARMAALMTECTGEGQLLKPPPGGQSGNH